LIFLIPVDDAILRCPIWAWKSENAVEGLYAPGRRVLGVGADVAAAAVWVARQRVAKEQVCRRERRAIEVAVRIAAEAEVAGLMAGAVVWMV
jgi:hypothetical protein